MTFNEAEFNQIIAKIVSMRSGNYSDREILMHFQSKWAGIKEEKRLNHALIDEAVSLTLNVFDAADVTKRDIVEYMASVLRANIDRGYKPRDADADEPKPALDKIVDSLGDRFKAKSDAEKPIVAIGDGGVVVIESNGVRVTITGAGGNVTFERCGDLAVLKAEM